MEKKRIYLIAICGTAMGSLAGLLKSAGYDVYGSDKNIYPPMSDFLNDQNIPILEGFDPAHLNPRPDLVVIGNAMSRGNPEVEYVLNNKIPYKSLPVVLKEFFIQGKTSLVVTGTHGKTTASSLLSWVLEKNEADPGFMIGGIPLNFDRGYKIGNGKYFVSEGDEYDTAFFDKGPKFLHYLPDAVIINNIEFDHADIYNNIDEIKLNFQRLINIIPQNGCLIANGDDANVRDLIPKALCPVQTFGFSDRVTWKIQNMTVTENATAFSLYHEHKFFAEFKIPLSGVHNVRNAAAVAIILNWHGFSNSQIQSGFSTFKGIKRRQQLRANINGVSIYDDFAHHPTAIRETIEGMRQQFPNKKIWAVYEPRTSTAKRNLFFDDYLNSFNQADEIIFGPIHRPDKVQTNALLDIPLLFKKFHASGKKAIQFTNVQEIIDFLIPKFSNNDIVLIMSNGSFENIHERLIDALK